MYTLAERARRVVSVCLCIVLWSGGPSTAGGERDVKRWPRVALTNYFTRARVREALTLFARRLEDPRCRSLLHEFTDKEGRPLVDRLSALRLDHIAYLETLYFVDGDTTSLCRSGEAFAFTSPGRRVVYICNRAFERLWPGHTRHAQIVVIHEILHTLGLPENPPPAASINNRVRSACVQ